MFPKSTLVMYQGGGYDGCFYEWNYAFIDDDGQFHDIASTGYKGCDTMAKLQKAYERRPKDFDLYELPEEADRFSREAPVAHLIGVAKWFAENFPCITFVTECEHCGNKCNVVECLGDDAHGCGGVAIEYGKIVCENCCDTE
jgi:hypothetical protein